MSLAMEYYAAIKTVGAATRDMQMFVHYTVVCWDVRLSQDVRLS